MATQSDAFLDDVNSAYAQLRADSAEWEEELAERGRWDQTLDDGSDES